MRKRLAVAFVLVAVVAAVLVARWWRLRGAHGAPNAESPQGSGVDYRLSPLLAGYSAADGGTACETAYNGFRAVDEGSKGNGMKVPWTTFPDRDTFLARCAALPEQEQECMQFRYAAQHHDVCDPIAAKYDKHNPLWN